MEDNASYKLCVLCCYSFPASTATSESEVEILESFILNLQLRDTLSVEGVLRTEGILLCKPCLSEVLSVIKQNENFLAIEAEVRQIQYQLVVAMKKLNAVTDDNREKVRRLEEKINSSDESLLLRTLVKHRRISNMESSPALIVDKLCLFGIKVMNSFWQLKRFRHAVLGNFAISKPSTAKKSDGNPDTVNKPPNSLNTFSYPSTYFQKPSVVTLSPDAVPSRLHKTFKEVTRPILQSDTSADPSISSVESLASNAIPVDMQNYRNVIGNPYFPNFTPPKQSLICSTCVNPFEQPDVSVDKVLPLSSPNALVTSSVNTLDRSLSDALATELQDFLDEFAPPFTPPDLFCKLPNRSPECLPSIPVSTTQQNYAPQVSPLNLSFNPTNRSEELLHVSKNSMPGKLNASLCEMDTPFVPKDTRVESSKQSLERLSANTTPAQSHVSSQAFSSSLAPSDRSNESAIYALERFSLYTRHDRLSSYSGSERPRRTQSKVCSICGITCEDSQSLLLHAQASHLRSGYYKCPICPAFFPSLSKFSRHFHNIHATSRNRSRMNAANGFEPCRFCGKLINLSLRRSHIYHCHERRSPPSVCHKCGVTFNSKYVLKKHLLYYCPAANKTWNCEICGIEGFSTEGFLNMHKKTHVPVGSLKSASVTSRAT